MSTIRITKRFSFEAGHALYGYDGKCKNLHGHRYAIEVTVKGEIGEQTHESDFGMVMDFKDAKNLIKKVIVDEWDHAFIAYEKDLEVISFLNTLDNHKTVILKRVPTAENMALTALEMLASAFKNEFGDLIRPTKVRLYETPNNWADALAT